MTAAPAGGETLRRAARVLALASDALAPNSAKGTDAAVARLLLGHALTMLAASVEGRADGEPPPEQAIDVLERAGLLELAPGGTARARDALALLLSRSHTPDADELVRAEAVLTACLRARSGVAPYPPIVRWGRRGALLLLVVAVGAAAVPALPVGGRWTQYRWTSSSAAYGFPSAGTLGSHRTYGLVFHTKNETNPWVTIDLLGDRTIHEVTIENRVDCCDERCLPLVVEVAGEDGQFTEMARRTKTFAVWTASFAPRSVRTVRLRVEAQTTFHLAGVEIR